MGKLGKDSAEALMYIYQRVLMDSELLVTAAATKGITIRAAYESVLKEIEQLKVEMAQK